MQSSIFLIIILFYICNNAATYEPERSLSQTRQTRDTIHLKVFLRYNKIKWTIKTTVTSVVLQGMQCWSHLSNTMPHLHLSHEKHLMLKLWNYKRGTCLTNDTDLIIHTNQANGHFAVILFVSYFQFTAITVSDVNHTQYVRHAEKPALTMVCRNCVYQCSIMDNAYCHHTG